jgi:hypothetical protein
LKHSKKSGSISYQFTATKTNQSITSTLETFLPRLHEKSNVKIRREEKQHSHLIPKQACLKRIAYWRRLHLAGIMNGRLAKRVWFNAAGL